MKDYFINKFKENTVEFTREYINANDIWYQLAVESQGNQTKYRMHNNKTGEWKIMGNRIPYHLLNLEQDFNEVICRNEGLKFF